MLINPVGILRRHQREVRHPRTTMTNVSTEANKMKMKTLDKMWKNTQQEEEDVVMEDKEQQNTAETVDDNSNYEVNSEKHANDNNDDDDEDKKRKVQRTTYEFAVRIKIRADNKEQAHENHKLLINAMGNELEHLRLYSRKNEIIDPEKITNTHFDYHEVGRQTKYFIVVHGMESNEPYHQIRRNKNIFQSLKTTKCYIQQHLWSEKEWNIVTIGFLSGVSPKHQAKEVVKRSFTNEYEKSPKYELSAATIKTHQHGTTFSTFAYEVKCKATDSTEVCDYIAKMSQTMNTTLLKHKWKYTNSDVYINGIKKQNEHIQQIRTIPIYGIIEEAMDYLYQPLLSNKHVIDVSPTAKTPRYGRWNVYTKAENFECTTKWLQTNLKALYQEHCNPVHPSQVPASFIPEVKFNSTVDFQTQKKDQHLANARSAVSSYSSSPASSWASVVSGYTGYTVNSKTISQPTSSISSLNDLHKTLQTIQASIETICIRLEKIEQRLEDHDKALTGVQQFKTDTNSHMDKLASILQKLEERTNYITPRRLDHSFHQMEPNKRQDTRSSPVKGSQRS